MEKLVLVIHILAALAIIALILMQQGKGASAGASFGSGASQTVFGSEGGGNFFTRATAIFALIFFCTSFGLAIIAKNSASVNSEAIPAVVDSAPANNDAKAPANQQAQTSSESDVPSAGNTAAPSAGSDVPNASAADATNGSDVPAAPASK